jgi:hypothetical protein
MSQHLINYQERICVLTSVFLQKEFIIPTVLHVIQLSLAVALSIDPAELDLP